MRLKPTKDIEEIIIQAKIEMADELLHTYGADIIDYIREEDKQDFLNYWKGEYNECYLCGDELECEHLVNSLEEKEQTNE